MEKRKYHAQDPPKRQRSASDFLQMGDDIGLNLKWAELEEHSLKDRPIEFREYHRSP